MAKFINIVFDPKIHLWPFATKMRVSFRTCGSYKMQNLTEELTEITPKTHLSHLKLWRYEILINGDVEFPILRMTSKFGLQSGINGCDFVCFAMHKVISRSDVILMGADIIYFFCPDFDDINFEKNRTLHLDYSFT